MSGQNLNFIRKTYDLARKAVGEGNHPFGAMAVLDNHIIATACNLVVTSNDSTRHAEMILASYLSQNFDRTQIECMTVFCSTEPCTMCAGALYWVGSRHIIFGCSVLALGKYTTKSFSVPVRDSLSAVTSKIKIEGPLCELEGEEIHKNFWNYFGGKK